MDDITLEAFLWIMAFLVPLAIYKGITEEAHRAKDDQNNDTQ